MRPLSINYGIQGRASCAQLAHNLEELTITTSWSSLFNHKYRRIKPFTRYTTSFLLYSFKKRKKKKRRKASRLKLNSSMSEKEREKKRKKRLKRHATDSQMTADRVTHTYRPSHWTILDFTPNRRQVQGWFLFR